jgi:hypothetical protein
VKRVPARFLLLLLLLLLDGHIFHRSSNRLFLLDTTNTRDEMVNPDESQNGQDSRGITRSGDNTPVGGDEHLGHDQELSGRNLAQASSTTLRRWQSSGGADGRDVRCGRYG